MDCEMRMELYEAVYFFNRINKINCFGDGESPRLKTGKEVEKSGICESVYKAIIRILVVNKLLDYDGGRFWITGKNKEKHRYILDNIINKNQNTHYKEMFDKTVGESQYFFDRIGELEYEIYSRYNFPVTFEIGKEAVKHINLDDRKALELGGNSGGLGTAFLKGNKNCLYTVVDAKIPCMVGNEFKETNGLDITFIEGNIFELKLPDKLYDYIIMANLLHDFDDIKCLNILRNCIKHCDSNTKFLIIEDILTDEFEPKEIIMHGLRLSAECRGGGQRTAEELENLFFNINYGLEKTIKLNDIHTMLVMGAR